MHDIDLSKYLNIHSPGYVIEIYENGTKKEYVYGNKMIMPTKEKTTKDTLFDIASLTKVFTATLVYMAYEEKLVDLNDYVYDINSNFKNLKNIKIIDLLSHNQDIWTVGYLGDAKNINEFYSILYSSYIKSNFPTYADTHYIILSVLLEKIYNESYDKLCIKKIFRPLGLHNTTFNPNPSNCASNNYEQTSNKIIDNIYPGMIHDTKARIAKNFGLYLGHSSIFTTGDDLLIFLKTFLNHTLLNEQTINLMLQHRNINKENLNRLKAIFKGNDINEMYEKSLTDNYPVALAKTYNHMGTRYRNKIEKMNDVPRKASDNSISFSGYTGPMFTIDFDNNIIVIIMCNVVHNSKLNRYERKDLTVEIMNIIFDKYINI